jgi:hypothetical protein
MPPSDAQKRASNKYNLKNMATIGCKVKKEEAALFKQFCKDQGKTSNTVLKDFVLACIYGPETEEPPDKPPDGP